MPGEFLVVDLARSSSRNFRSSTKASHEMMNDREVFQQEIARSLDSLIRLAQLKLSPSLRAKVSPSDIVQQSLLQAHQHLDQFRGGTEAGLAAWLRRILVRNLIDTRRRYHSRKRDVSRERSLESAAERSPRSLECWTASEESSPSKRAEHEEQLLRLAKALARLPSEQRVVLELKHLHGWTVAEIGRHLEKSETAVAGLLRRGLQRMREILNDQE